MLKLVLGHIIMVKDLVLSYWTMSRVLEMKLLFLTALTQTTQCDHSSDAGVDCIAAAGRDCVQCCLLCMFGIILF